MSDELKVIYKPVNDLIPYVNNAKIHEPAQVELIASSIHEFGFTNPILLDGKNGLIAGHGRLMAAKRLDIETVPTIELSHLTPHQKRAYILADNRIGEVDTSWDMDLVNLEMEDLQLEDFDIEDLEFNLIDDGVIDQDDMGSDGLDVFNDVGSVITIICDDEDIIEITNMLESLKSKFKFTIKIEDE